MPASAALAVALWIWSLPIPEDLQKPLAGTLTLLDCRGRELAEIASPQARAQFPRKLDEMGEWLPRMTVALEDHRFFKHAGIDWRATAAACVRDLKARRIVSGGSTITQQLVKMASGRSRRSWSGKIYEAILAWKIERRWSKQRILAEYLNRSSYGNRRLGPEAAARAYFGKSARELTLAEAIFLAGLPQAPTRFNPWHHAGRADEKYHRCLARLAELGVITREQQALLGASPPVARRFDPPRLAPHFVDAVVAQMKSSESFRAQRSEVEEQGRHSERSALGKREVEESRGVSLQHSFPNAPRDSHSTRLRLAQGRLSTALGMTPKGAVNTTLDIDLQALSERLLRAHLAALNRGDITQAAIVVIENSTGAMRAMVGSENYATCEINGAMRARSCGSTLKPFLYLAAIDRRLLTAASLLPDTPDAIRDEYADYDPQNFSHRYLGPVRVREALGCSLNVPAVVALSRLGARSAFYELQKWGFDFPRALDDYGAGFILGNAEIRLVDLAGTYAGLARGGLAMRAKFLSSEHHPITRIASKEATEIVTDILWDNDAREKSFGTHSPLAFERRIAAKTGTSSGFRDAWTVGFDKEHTVAVWVGNFDGRPMRDTLAVRAAAPLWAAMMGELLRRGDHPLDPPEESEKLVRREICAATGLLPSPFSAAKTSELFLKGTEPAQDSASWFSADGSLLLPPEYAAWCASRDNASGARIRPEPRIINPPANARYQIDPVLPRSQQMIEFTATLGEGTEWFVNGAQVLPQRDGRFFWQLAPGEWRLRAASRTATAEGKIIVE